MSYEKPTKEERELARVMISTMRVIENLEDFPRVANAIDKIKICLGKYGWEEAKDYIFSEPDETLTVPHPNYD